MSVPRDRLLIASRCRVLVTGKTGPLERFAIRIGKLVTIPQLLQRAAIGELPEAHRQKILRAHPAARGRIDRAARDSFSAERIPREIDGRQTDRRDILGERLVIDSRYDSLALPPCGTRNRSYRPHGST